MWLWAEMNGEKSLRMVVDGKSGCFQWYSLSKDRIYAPKYWTYIDYDIHYLRFNE
jgi:hypothetical protein